MSSTFQPRSPQLSSRSELFPQQTKNLPRIPSASNFSSSTATSFPSLSSPPIAPTSDSIRCQDSPQESHKSPPLNASRLSALDVRNMAFKEMQHALQRGFLTNSSTPSSPALHHANTTTSAPATNSPQLSSLAKLRQIAAIPVSQQQHLLPQINHGTDSPKSPADSIATIANLKQRMSNYNSNNPHNTLIDLMSQSTSSPQTKARQQDHNILTQSQMILARTANKSFMQQQQQQQYSSSTTNSPKHFSPILTPSTPTVMPTTLSSFNKELKLEKSASAFQIKPLVKQSPGVDHHSHHLHQSSTMNNPTFSPQLTKSQYFSKTPQIRPSSKLYSENQTKINNNFLPHSSDLLTPINNNDNNKINTFHRRGSSQLDPRSAMKNLLNLVVSPPIVLEKEQQQQQQLSTAETIDGSSTSSTRSSLMAITSTTAATPTTNQTAATYKVKVNSSELLFSSQSSLQIQTTQTSSSSPPAQNQQPKLSVQLDTTTIQIGKPQEPSSHHLLSSQNLLHLTSSPSLQLLGSSNTQNNLLDPASIMDTENGGASSNRSRRSSMTLYRYNLSPEEFETLKTECVQLIKRTFKGDPYIQNLIERASQKPYSQLESNILRFFSLCFDQFALKCQQIDAAAATNDTPTQQQQQQHQTFLSATSTTIQTEKFEQQSTSNLLTSSTTIFTHAMSQIVPDDDSIQQIWDNVSFPFSFSPKLNLHRTLLQIVEHKPIIKKRLALFKQILTSNAKLYLYQPDLQRELSGLNGLPNLLTAAISKYKKLSQTTAESQQQQSAIPSLHKSMISSLEIGLQSLLACDYETASKLIKQKCSNVNRIEANIGDRPMLSEIDIFNMKMALFAALDEQDLVSRHSVMLFLERVEVLRYSTFTQLFYQQLQSSLDQFSSSVSRVTTCPLFGSTTANREKYLPFARELFQLVLIDNQPASKIADLMKQHKISMTSENLIEVEKFLLSHAESSVKHLPLRRDIVWRCMKLKRIAAAASQEFVSSSTSTSLNAMTTTSISTNQSPEMRLFYEQVWDNLPEILAELEAYAHRYFALSKSHTKEAQNTIESCFGFFSFVLEAHVSPFTVFSVHDVLAAYTKTGCTQEQMLFWPKSLRRAIQKLLPSTSSVFIAALEDMLCENLTINNLK